MQEQTPMTPSPAGESPRTALRQGVLVLCAVAALFTAVSTSLESQRTVARLATSGTAEPAAHTPDTNRWVATTESCSAR
jgi:hypothetical protein